VARSAGRPLNISRAERIASPFHPRGPVMTPEWIAEHLDLFKYVFGLVIVIIGFFTVRTLKQIDANQQQLFIKLNNLSDEFHVLKGEHIAMQCRVNKA
jgi:hypothetical protein